MKRNIEIQSQQEWQTYLNNLEELITNLRNTSSTKEKTALLENEKNKDEKYVEVLQNILHDTYSPREVFYIKPIKDSSNINTQLGNSSIENMNIFDVLNMFQNYVRGNKAINLYHDFKTNCSNNGCEFESELLDLVLNKDLKAGVATNTINKVFPKLIPQQPYMRCSLVKQVNPEDWLKDGLKIYAQEKMDGMFVNFTVNEDRSIEFSSRSGTIFPENEAFNSLREAAKYLDNAKQYHGELLVINKHTGEYLPREIGNGILNSITKEGKKGSQFNPEEHDLQFVAWDSIELAQLNEDFKGGVDYEQRFNQISSTIQNVKDQSGNQAIKLVDTKIVDNLDEAADLFRQYLLEGKEGVCLKLNSMQWEDGTSKQIIKLKNVFEIDLKIVGFTPGNGKNEQYFGSISTESSDGKLKVDVSGFTDELRKEIWENRDDYIGKIMAVKATTITKTDDNTYSLFLPRFAEFRQDKHEADSFERIQQQYDESLNEYNPANELRQKLAEKLRKKANKKSTKKVENDDFNEPVVNKQRMKI